MWFDYVACAEDVVWLRMRTCRDLIVYVHKMWFDCRCRRCGLLNWLCHATTWPPEVLTCDQASSVICLQINLIPRMATMVLNICKHYRRKTISSEQGSASSAPKQYNVCALCWSGFKYTNRSQRLSPVFGGNGKSCLKTSFLAPSFRRRRSRRHTRGVGHNL